jgi:shikimate dehydrogenase
MRKFGLIGYPLSHSFSPTYFAEKFKREAIVDAQYELYPIDNIGLLSGLLDGTIQGLNVTIPYKQAVFPFLDEIHPDAQEMGAVNTIKIDGHNIKGYNTDVYGFENSLLHFISESQVERALVLGTGGSARAVWFVLNRLGIEYLKVSRSQGDLQYEEIDKLVMTHHQLIINTTPLGMSPNPDACPNIPYELISREHYLFDLIYNPVKTLFLQHGERQGANINNGLEMLKLQADRSWEIWNE